MTAIPTLFSWLGGMPVLERLTATFYARVPQDPLLAPVFARMSPEHPQHVGGQAVGDDDARASHGAPPTPCRTACARA